MNEKGNFFFLQKHLEVRDCPPCVIVKMATAAIVIHAGGGSGQKKDSLLYPFFFLDTK